MYAKCRSPFRMFNANTVNSQYCEPLRKRELVREIGEKFAKIESRKGKGREPSTSILRIEKLGYFTVFAVVI